MEARTREIQKRIESMNTLEKFTRLYFQCACDSADVGKADILASSFNAPYVRRMESRQFRQCFLR